MTVSEKTQSDTTMTELTVRVPTRLVEMARAQVESGRFADVDAVVGDALRQVDERERQLFHLRALIQEGIDSGDAVELTDELWDEIEHRAEERYVRGEMPDPVVCP